MQLLIKQKVFSWTDTYDIFDESGEARYYVKAEFLSLGHQIHVYDKCSGREVGSIHQKLLTFLPQFEIIVGGQPMGSVRREFSFLRPSYHVDYFGWDVEGDFLGWEYEARSGNALVMSVSKQLFRWGDTYVLNYSRIEDEIPGLLLVLAIEANCSDD